jgi:hypothetical protein
LRAATGRAESTLPPIKKFTAHRSWEDWLLLILGALIFLSPLLSGSGYRGSPAASAVIVGLIMIFVAELEIVALFWWEEIINLLCGAWIMLAPLLLGYGGQLRVWHFGLGGLVVIITVLELWQDKRGGGTIS